MSRAARWTCPACRRPLGAVDRRGRLVVDGHRVEVTTEAGRLAVVVFCVTCREGRAWAPAAPKACQGAGSAVG